MEKSVNHDIATCPTCGTMIDVGDQEPYAKIHCSSCGTWMRVQQQFANYDITGVLGEGGQGMVYRAVDRKLNRNVAIKLMKREYSSDPIFVKRFESEAKVTASLNNPNIVKVFSFGEDRGLLYLAMELVDHGSLDALMAQITKVPEDRVLEVGVQIARGLKAGLEKGLIHRDIKPGNILFADEHTAKIVDFGLAVLVEKQHEEEGDVWATPYYVAPEKLDGTPEDFRSDMYSLAATLFHAIAGRPPFIAETSSMSELKAIKSKPVHLASYAPQVSTATAYVIDKALAVHPKDRWASYEEFIENLEYAQNELRKGKARSRRPNVVAAGAGARSQGNGILTILLVAAVVAMGLYIYYTRNSPTTPMPVIGAPTPAPRMTAEEAEIAYEAARQQMIGGKFRPAASTFRGLYADGLLPEPRHTWSAVNEGLAELLEGRAAPSRKAFKQVAQKLAPNALGMDDKLVAFIRHLAETASNDQSVPPSVAETFDKASYEAIALLILGLKNWENGDFTSGVMLLHRFQSAIPVGEGAWVGDYRPLVGRYLEEYAAYKNVADDLAKFETDPVRAEAALKRIPEAKEKIKTSGLVAKLSALERELEPKISALVAATNDEMTKKMAEQEAIEEQTLTEAKLAVKNLSENYRFAEALASIEAINVKSEAHIKDRNLLKQRIEWLVQFKELLIKDLATGYAGPLQRRNGQPLPGGVIRASESQLSIRVGQGSAVIGWAELTPKSVLAMARAFVTPGLSPSDAADRKWLAGVFSIFTGLYADSEVLMGEAAAAKEEYRLHKALFFGESEPAPTPAPPTGQPATPAKEDPATGLEMSKEPLNPNRSSFDEAVMRALRRPGNPQ